VQPSVAVVSKPVRCAIYTRKSTEEGLEQDFNSLDAQRESAEAYILSQRHEQWAAVSERYDDGGFTGANTERPALKKLLGDVEAGKIDCVVVYKVDRLSRSLLDFSRIVEVFDKHAVSFVSVTQQFNTTSSMGRLTLNILLSFAQFEREIISERTRDKMIAARRKGKWTGGFPALGYDVDPVTRRLAINEAEAKRVRAIFDMFLETDSLAETLVRIDQFGWKTKAWKTQKGREREGLRFDRPALLRVLTNILYIGEVRHGGKSYPGEQPPIVDRDVWTRVNQRLETRRRPMRRKQRQSALLEGLLACGICGKQMGHGYTTKAGRRYRYYLCQTARKGGARLCPKQTAGARRIETAILARLAELAKLPKDQQGMITGDHRTLLESIVEQIRYDHRGDRAILQLRATRGAGAEIAITVRKDPSGRRYSVKPPSEKVSKPPEITRVMALAIQYQKMIDDGTVANCTELARRVKFSTVRVSQILKLRSLAPELQERLLFLKPDSKYLPEIAVRRVAEELDWAKQAVMFDQLAEAAPHKAERNTSGS